MYFPCSVSLFGNLLEQDKIVACAERNANYKPAQNAREKKNTVAGWRESEKLSSVTVSVCYTITLSPIETYSVTFSMRCAALGVCLSVFFNWFIAHRWVNQATIFVILCPLGLEQRRSVHRVPRTLAVTFTAACRTLNKCVVFFFFCEQTAILNTLTFFLFFLLIFFSFVSEFSVSVFVGFFFLFSFNCVAWVSSALHNPFYLFIRMHNVLLACKVNANKFCACKPFSSPPQSCFLLTLSLARAASSRFGLHHAGVGKFAFCLFLFVSFLSLDAVCTNKMDALWWHRSE